MSAEFSTDIELYHGTPAILRAMPDANVIDQLTNESRIEVPLHPELIESTVHITRADSECFPDCPIIKHGLTEIMNEPNKAVIKSIIEWVNGVHEKCSAGPQRSIKPRFFIVGAEVEEVSCGSVLSRHHPKQRTSRTKTK